MNLGEFRRVLKQAFLVPLFALIVLGGILLWQSVTVQKAQHAVDHSDRIRARVAELERLIIDQETGLRGYELTGDDAMLAPYKAAAQPIDRHFDGIRRLVVDNPEQLGNLVRIHDGYQLWLGFAQGVMAAPHTADTDNQLNHRGKQLMDSLRASLLSMVQAEDKIRAQRLHESLAMEHQEIIVIAVGALLVGLLLSTFSLTRLRQVSRAYQGSLDQLQKRTDEIYESREWLQTTLRSIGDAVIVCAADSAVQFMNSVAEDLTGWTMEDAQTKPLQTVFHIVHEKTREEAENPVEKVRRLNKVIGLANHTMLLARNGAEYIIDDSAAPIYDKSQNLIGIVLVFRDVTEQRRTAAALIASEKLAVAGRLAASIAHEIHNPLDSVANLHYLLGEETDPVKRAEYLKMAQQELNRTMQISRTMLNLYREPNAPVNVDLSELLEGVLLLLQRRLHNQGISIERDFDGDFVIEGFPAELRQVFTNLIMNAADAAGADGTILIRTRGIPAEELRGAGILVEIVDSGPGIANEAAKKLFQPFFTTKGENGTGLGLWVSMGIVQKHGGTIRASNSHDSELRGASMRVYLPAQTLATPSSRTTAHLS